MRLLQFGDRPMTCKLAVLGTAYSDGPKLEKHPKLVRDTDHGAVYT